MQIKAKVKAKGKENVINNMNIYCIITDDIVVLIVIGTIT
jgi:hypothetical protein